MCVCARIASINVRITLNTALKMYTSNLPLTMDLKSYFSLRKHYPDAKLIHVDVFGRYNKLQVSFRICT